MTNILSKTWRVGLYAAGAFIAAAATGSTEAAQMTSIEIGNWKGGAYSNNETGEFSHCAASAKYRNGQTLLLSISRDKTWSVGFANDGWNLDPGSKHPVRLKVDDGHTYSGTASARTRYLVQVMLPRSKRLFEQFRNGLNFHIKTRNGEINFALTDVDRLLGILVRCARHHRQASTNLFSSNRRSADPFGSSSGRQSSAVNRTAESPTRRTAQTRTEAFTAVSFMLSKAKIRASYLTGPKHEKLLARNDVAWSMDGTIGALRVITQASITMQQARERIARSDESRCAGRFVSNSISPADARFVDFLTACNRIEGAGDRPGMAVYYAMLPRREGGYYLMSVIGRLTDHGRVRKLGTRLKSVAVRLNENGSVPGARSVSY